MSKEVLIITIVFAIVILLAIIWCIVWHIYNKKEYDKYIEEEYGKSKDNK